MNIFQCTSFGQWCDTWLSTLSQNTSHGRTLTQLIPDISIFLSLAFAILCPIQLCLLAGYSNTNAWPYPNNIEFVQLFSDNMVLTVFTAKRFRRKLNTRGRHIIHRSHTTAVVSGANQRPNVSVRNTQTSSTPNLRHRPKTSHRSINTTPPWSVLTARQACLTPAQQSKPVSRPNTTAGDPETNPQLQQ